MAKFCNIHNKNMIYSKTCVKERLKKSQNKDLNDKWQLNEGPPLSNNWPIKPICDLFESGRFTQVLLYKLL